jgi:hypothetical protein
MKLLISLFILINFHIQSQTDPQIHSALYFSDGRNTVRTLRFGVDPLATDGIDLIFGESLVPPFPPAGILEAQFFLPTGGFNGTEAVYWDFRNGTIPMNGTREHRIKYQKGAGDSVIISWNLPPSMQATLQDIVTGNLFNMQLTGSGSFIMYPVLYNTLKFFVQYNNTTDVGDNKSPAKHELFGNYPNPFNPLTSIRYSLSKREHVQLNIFDLQGKGISELVNKEQLPGTYEVSFNAQELVSGIYFYKITAGEFSQTRSMLLLK